MTSSRTTRERLERQHARVRVALWCARAIVLGTAIWVALEWFA